MCACVRACVCVFPKLFKSTRVDSKNFHLSLEEKFCNLLVASVLDGQGMKKINNLSSRYCKSDALFEKGGD